MTQAFALARTQLTFDHAEWTRRALVCACALSLILAGQALPF